MTITKTIVTAELSTSVEQVTAFAHNLGGLLEDTDIVGDRTIMKFSFDKYHQANGFQYGLGSMKGVISSQVSR